MARGSGKPKDELALNLWALVTRQYVEVLGSQSLLAAAAAVVQTTGFTLALAPPRSVFYVRRYAVTFYEHTPISEQLFQISPKTISIVIPGTDAAGNLLAAGEYSEPAFPSHILGFTNSVPGLNLSNAAAAFHLTDDWFDSETYRVFNGGPPPASFRILGSSFFFNADAANPRTVSWREMLEYEQYVPRFGGVASA